METNNMSNKLFLIVAISWFANDIGRLGSVELEPVNHISSDTYELIERRLTILGVYDKNKSVRHFNRKCIEKVKNIWRTPEICEWKDVIGKIEPENNLCLIVAVYLSTQMPAETETVTPTKNYTPYECFKMAVNNVKSKLVMKPRKKVIYCPKTTVISGTMRHQHIQINSFLIGRGDNRRNSIYVYRFNNGGKSMDLMHYMYNVLTYSELKVGHDEYWALNRMQIQKDYRLSESRTANERFLKYRKDRQTVDNLLDKRWCKKSVRDNMNICGDLSVFRNFSSDARVTNSVLDASAQNEYHQEAGNKMPSNVIQRARIDSIDESGFLAYVCINRPVKIHTSVYKQDMIFCPQQIITTFDTKITFRQSGFFYSADFDEDSYFIYDVNYRQADVTTFNGRGGTVEANAHTINDVAIENIHGTETEFEIFDSITLSSKVESTTSSPYTLMHR